MRGFLGEEPEVKYLSVHAEKIAGGYLLQVDKGQSMKRREVFMTLAELQRAIEKVFTTGKID